jgi:hypothetical protein
MISERFKDIFPKRPPAIILILGMTDSIFFIVLKTIFSPKSNTIYLFHLCFFRKTFYQSWDPSRNFGWAFVDLPCFHTPPTAPRALDSFSQPKHNIINLQIISQSIYYSINLNPFKPPPTHL